MKCKDCSSARKGFFKSQPEKHVCIGTKEPFIIENFLIAECCLCESETKKKIDSVNKYRTKPCEVEAIKWNGINLEELKVFVGDALNYDIIDTAWQVGKGRPHVLIKINTLEGVTSADEGDYIVKGLRGEFYPCKPDIFERKYELIEN